MVRAKLAVLHFDSFNTGTQGVGVCQTLFDYLETEWRLRKAPALAAELQDNDEAEAKRARTSTPSQIHSRSGPSILESVSGFLSSQNCQFVLVRGPRQSNFVDCGVFVLHYVELFLHKPFELSSSPLKVRDCSDFRANRHRLMFQYDHDTYRH